MGHSAGRRTQRKIWIIGVGYVLCWVTGLLIGGPSIDPGSSAEEIQAAYSESSAVLFSILLVHGIAAAFLVAFGLSVASGASTFLVSWLAIAAAALSLVQLIGELVLILLPEDFDAVAIWDGITRVDGMKMFVLAGFIAAVHVDGAGKPRWLWVVSAAAVLALLVSGIGYLAVSPPLMAFATASLPLLLIWVLAATAARTFELQAEHQQI